MSLLVRSHERPEPRHEPEASPDERIVRLGVHHRLRIRREFGPGGMMYVSLQVLAWHAPEWESHNRVRIPWPALKATILAIGDVGSNK